MHLVRSGELEPVLRTNFTVFSKRVEMILNYLACPQGGELKDSRMKGNLEGRLCCATVATLASLIKDFVLWLRSRLWFF
jgi:hypothetical protein